MNIIQAGENATTQRLSTTHNVFRCVCVCVCVCVCERERERERERETLHISMSDACRDRWVIDARIIGIGSPKIHQSLPHTHPWFSSLPSSWFQSPKHFIRSTLTWSETRDHLTHTHTDTHTHTAGKPCLYRRSDWCSSAAHVCKIGHIVMMLIRDTQKRTHTHTHTMINQLFTFGILSLRLRLSFFPLPKFLRFSLESME